MKVGTASGYTIEGEDAYYPKSPEYYLANPNDKYCDWIHQRDEMYWMTWGRLGYDPLTIDATFDARAKELLGPAGTKDALEAWKDASLIVPTIYMAHALGPDHRDHAPELEWGGDTDTFMNLDGFDEFSYQSIAEELANQATGGLDGRVTMHKVAVKLEELSERIQRSLAKVMAPGVGRFLELKQSAEAEIALANYYEFRIASAEAFAS